MTIRIEADIKERAIDGLKGGIGQDNPVSELHHYLFNEDYFIIGYHEAEQWLINNPGIFNAIETIKQYEQDNFGEVNTDLSCSEKVVNMYAYIQGENLLSKSDTISNNWDKDLTVLMSLDIVEELETVLEPR